jgi:hypothetical protein
LAGSATQLTGNTIWVDAVYGNDTTGEANRPDRPFLTIQAAIATATAPAIVSVNSGSYTGPLTLKNGVDISCMGGVSITAAVDIINTYTISDGGVSVTCSITGKPSIFLIEGSAPPAGACIHLSNTSSRLFVDIESLTGDTSDIDMGMYLVGGRVTGYIGSIKTTSYDGIWIASENSSMNLDIGSIQAGDNPIEVTACAASEVRAGYLSGNGVNVVTSNEDADICISAQRCQMTGPSFFQTVNGGTVKAMVNLGQYDAGGGVGIQGVCDGVVISGTRIFNSTNPINLTGVTGGYQFDDGAILGCVLVGSGDSIEAPTASTIKSYGSYANTAVDGNVTVDGLLTVGAYVQ